MAANVLAFVAAPVVLITGMLAIPLLAVSDAEPPSLAAATETIPPRVLDAYFAAEQHCPGLRWQVLAGIGWVESRHGTTDGATIDPSSGQISPPILGSALDGRDGTQRHPVGRFRGRWGLTGPWEQALGPMQFRAPTFATWGVDANKDGTTDPHDIDDAAATAARYLCGTIGIIDDERKALARYNHDPAYPDRVLAYADTLDETIEVVEGPWICPIAGPTSFTDTWGAPRSGGRRHEGVDMFAAAGTPVIAPVSGELEHTDTRLGGRSFRLWGNDNTYYYGAHLEGFGQTTGNITAGTIIGYVGNTGNARGTPPHLHFEIHPNRARGEPPEPVNPTSIIATGCADHRLGPSLSLNRHRPTHQSPRHDT